MDIHKKAVFALLFSSSCLAQDAAPAVSVSRNGWELSLARTEPCADCIGEASFYLAAKKAGEPQAEIFRIESSAVTIKELAIHGNYGMVFGEMPYGGDAMSLVDLDSKNTLQEIYGYQAKRLNDDRFILFHKFYPRFSASQPSEIMLYDMNYAAEAAAFFKEKGIDAGFTIYSKASDDMNDVTFSHAVWDENAKMLLISLNKGASGMSLLTASPGDSMASLQDMKTCEIPILPGWDEASQVRAGRPNYQVEELVAENGTAHIKLFEVHGISGSFSVNYLHQCP